MEAEEIQKKSVFLLQGLSQQQVMQREMNCEVSFSTKALIWKGCQFRLYYRQNISF